MPRAQTQTSPLRMLSPPLRSTNCPLALSGSAGNIPGLKSLIPLEAFAFQNLQRSMSSVPSSARSMSMTSDPAGDSSSTVQDVFRSKNPIKNHHLNKSGSGECDVNFLKLRPRPTNPPLPGPSAAALHQGKLGSDWEELVGELLPHVPVRDRCSGQGSSGGAWRQCAHLPQDCALGVWQQRVTEPSLQHDIYIRRCRVSCVVCGEYYFSRFIWANLQLWL